MIGLLQRVSAARVSVANDVIGEIGRGLLVLVAIHRDDEERDIQRLADRILTYRVFPDAEDRMNLSVQDISGGLLLVPQFTLAADTHKGTRASFTKGAEHGKAADFFDQLAAICRTRLDPVETGQFAADMQVTLTNDGPVTFWLES
jgi:D-tyrosyl-tRNA(Tyr) deacylase